MGLNRRLSRFAIIMLLGGASMLLLAWESMISVARADNPDEVLNALMMGGTTMPTPSPHWLDTIVTDYIDPTTGGNYVPVLVPTPESGSSTSIATGLADLQAAMTSQQLHFPGLPYLVEGYSQSAVISVDEKIQLMQSGQPPPDVTFLLLGSLDRPDGGIIERFPGLGIPGTAAFGSGGSEPTDAGIPTIDIANQYDFFADFPQYPTNELADLNALFGIIYAHASYGDGPLPEEIPAVWPPSAPLTGPFTDHYVLGSTEVVKQVTGDTTFYFNPTTELPLLDPLRSLGVPESWLNVVQPALQVIVEAGYDRSIPFGDPTPAQLIPTIDPVTFSLEYDKAVVEGANNALALFGAQLPDAAELEHLLDQAQSWSAQDIGIPYHDAVSALNDYYNPFTEWIAQEAPLSQDIENLLEVTGIQQNLLDPVLGLIGPLGGLITS